MARRRVVALVKGATLPQVSSGIKRAFELKKIKPVELQIKRILDSIQVAVVITPSVKPGSIKTILNRIGKVSSFYILGGKAGQRLTNKRKIKVKRN